MEIHGAVRVRPSLSDKKLSKILQNRRFFSQAPLHRGGALATDFAQKAMGNCKSLFRRSKVGWAFEERCGMGMGFEAAQYMLPGCDQT